MVDYFGVGDEGDFLDEVRVDFAHERDVLLEELFPDPHWYRFTT